MYLIMVQSSSAVDLMMVQFLCSRLDSTPICTESTRGSNSMFHYKKKLREKHNGGVNQFCAVGRLS